MEVITEGQDTAYFPIDNPLAENANNIEVPLEGEEEICITLKSTPCKNINELWSQYHEVDDYNNPVNDNILKP